MLVTRRNRLACDNAFSCTPNRNAQMFSQYNKIIKIPHCFQDMILVPELVIIAIYDINMVSFASVSQSFRIIVTYLEDSALLQVSKDQ